MDNLYTNRVESKFLINKENLGPILKSLEKKGFIAELKDVYGVETIYLCKWKNEKDKGKIRIRIYNNSDAFIEEKKKINKISYKKRYKINSHLLEKYKSVNSLNELFVLNNEYGFDFDENYCRFGSFHKLHVNYSRKVYNLFNAEKLYRFTIDYNLKLTYCDFPKFVPISLISDDEIIMEFKSKNNTKILEIINQKNNFLNIDVSKFKLASKY